MAKIVAGPEVVKMKWRGEIEPGHCCPAADAACEVELELVGTPCPTRSEQVAEIVRLHNLLIEAIDNVRRNDDVEVIMHGENVDYMDEFGELEIREILHRS